MLAAAEPNAKPENGFGAAGCSPTGVAAFGAEDDAAPPKEKPVKGLGAAAAADAVEASGAAALDESATDDVVDGAAKLNIGFDACTLPELALPCASCLFAAGCGCEVGAEELALLRLPSIDDRSSLYLASILLSASDKSVNGSSSSNLCRGGITERFRPRREE